MTANTSSSTWPGEWGKEYHALLAFHDVFVRQNGDQVFLLDKQGTVFAQVPVSMEWHSLKNALVLLRASFALGYSQGRKDLAEEILSPITQALNQKE